MRGEDGAGQHIFIFTAKTFSHIYIKIFAKKCPDVEVYQRLNLNYLLLLIIMNPSFVNIIKAIGA